MKNVILDSPLKITIQMICPISYYMYWVIMLFFIIFFRFIHLTNNSIAKYSTKFDNSEIVGNMWTCDDFNKDLKVIYK